VESGAGDLAAEPEGMRLCWAETERDYGVVIDDYIERLCRGAG
jgi:hypothetical protein